MAKRPNSHHLGTIEYIGPRPQAKKPQRRPNFLGGWVVLLIAAGAAWFFGKPLLPLLRAQQTVASEQTANQLILELSPSSDFGERLAAQALQRTNTASIYDTAYYQITYPGGDIPKGGPNGDTWKGKAEDVLVRSYRSMGIDLQVLVHEDMTRNFASYPQLWGSGAPDSNIDHRRVENLQRYFKHAGAELPVTRDKKDYKPGDVVVWMLAQGEIHCGIVVPGPGNRSDEAWVVHDNGSGPKWENVLMENQIHGHYRFTGQALEVAKR
ncbi:DUF1287 domain-containing protein [Haloferula sp. BvORR071]|uniref:DUF1287 domain-containing protein n=1 Tax=Haloferula sp. BvORR071 TaxID=1396141 RepID=UPI000697E9E0|nr:DUF1287 domain-containing protein [Haloferula sp. BvORR071]